MRAMRTMAALSAILLATACGGTTPTETTFSPPASSSGAGVPHALRFSAKTLDGRTFDGTGLAGKPVAFWFWAPWCPKCRSEAPAVKAAAAKYGDVAFVGVAGLDTEPAMKDFVRSTGTEDLTHLSDNEGAVWTKLGVSSQSTFVFMKPDGSTLKASGPLTQDDLDGHLRTLLSR
ncbi:redoxin domain-containing protein [Nonomuraea terrae]|uniref:Redoxin domain-containing protein n=1 Tax=Nonomuraea terrae TaxID=2530383 RepID=A0A4V6PDQ6_9ACTN|nr:redoxin domain-containing protein [Nonomuraea terrae]TDD42607.1 redoxin domain-containing protein [Nonomuraea terrae]